LGGNIASCEKGGTARSRGGLWKVCSKRESEKKNGHKLLWNRGTVANEGQKRGGGQRHGLGGGSRPSRSKAGKNFFGKKPPENYRDVAQGKDKLKERSRSTREAVPFFEGGHEDNAVHKYKSGKSKKHEPKQENSIKGGEKA